MLSVRLWCSLLCQPFDEARCRPAEKTGEVVTDPGERSSSDSFINAYQEAGQFLVHPGPVSVTRNSSEVTGRYVTSRSRTTDIASAISA